MSSSLSPKATSKPPANSSVGPANVSSGMAPPAGKMPGETVRGLVSLWLIFHFFCVALALLTNPNIEPATSQIVARLRNAFSPYISVLWLDAPPDYYLTYNENLDADHVLVAEWDTPNGPQTREFPAADSRGEIRERYEALAKNAAWPLYNDSSDRDLVKGIGEGIIDQTGAKEVTFRIRRHSPLSIEDASADDPGQHDPNNKRTIAPVYTAVVSVNSLGEGQVNSLSEEARDVAPVTNRGNGNSSNPGGKTNSSASPKSNAPSGSRYKPADAMPPLPPNNNSSLPDNLKDLVPKDGTSKP